MIINLKQMQLDKQLGRKSTKEEYEIYLLALKYFYE